MEQTAVEKKISQQAQKRLENELRSLFEFITRHPIARSLRIKMKDGTFMPLAEHYSPRILNLDSCNEEVTNWKELKERLTEEYEKDALDEVLHKLESVSYLFK